MRPALQQQGQLYAVPYTYSTMGIIYDKRQFTRPPDSMNVLWDPRYRHKVLDFNSGPHNFSFAALASGIAKPFQLDDGKSVGIWMIFNRGHTNHSTGKRAHFLHTIPCLLVECSTRY